MKKILIFILLLMFMGCASTKPVVVQTKEEAKTILIDSVVVRDSIVIIPIERIVDIVAQYDTLHLQTSLAKSKAWIDTTTHTLKGEITNKEQAQNSNRTEIKYSHRIDSVFIEKPIPYPEPEPYVPKVAWLCIIFTCCYIVWQIAKIIWKFKIKGGS